MSALRWVTGTAGVALLGFGGWLLVAETRAGTVPDLLRWMVGALVAHDGVLAPLVLLAGAVLRWAYGRRGPGGRAGVGTGGTAPYGGGSYGVVRGGLLVGGCLTLVAVPMMLRQGESRNPTVLPLDYTANWLLLLAVTLAVTVALSALRAPAYRARLAALGHALGALPGRARRRVRRRSRRPRG
ncbi:hypothetical protein [Streptomyces phytohabitans]|uniref:hypothetical protein n=1 Tax=Streptomyces phytohabitans TaxID=1150371 RepID=UPI00345BBCF2